MTHHHGYLRLHMGLRLPHVLVLTISISRVIALDNGLARTPPMGWLSWERFGCEIDCEKFPDSCINERLYLEQAERLAKDGFQEAGYVYVDIDDCWSERERENGRIVADRKRFPNGLKRFSDQLHEMGLLFGLYGDIGTLTCAGYPGYQQEEGSTLSFDVDAQTLAEYGVDSIKVDGCYANVDDFSHMYPEFGRALNGTDRPILYSCSWPAYLPDHGIKDDVLNSDIRDHCNTWRNYGDIEDSFDSVKSIIQYWAENSKSTNDTMVRAAGPGHWNDPDMLVIGSPGLSIAEQRIQFALWAIFAAPLYIAADLRTISRESREILLNRQIIAVNQDPLGRQGYCVDCESNHVQAWVRELTPFSSITNISESPAGTSDHWAVAFVNTHTIFADQEVFFDPSLHLGRSWIGPYCAMDLYNTTNIQRLEGPLVTKVDESSVKMYRLTRSCEFQIPTGPTGSLKVVAY